MDNIKSENKNNQEIDFISLFYSYWDKRKFFIKIVLITCIVGLIVTILRPKEYTVSCTIIPQVSDNKSKIGGLSGLAAMAGINVDNNTNSEVLPPVVYPKLMQNVSFKKELLYSKVHLNNLKQEISIFEYYTNPKYRNFNILKFIKKYTVGLPNVIIKNSRNYKQDSSFVQLTSVEEDVSDILFENIDLMYDKKEGFLTLVVTMPNAELSAEIANRFIFLLQKYITSFKIEKEYSNLVFVQERFDEAQRNFYNTQQQLAITKDINRDISSQLALIKIEKLTSEYELQFNIYNELAKQLEQTKIQIKKTTPILTVVDPITIPNKKSSPLVKQSLIISAFIGLILGVIIASYNPLYIKTKEYWILNKLLF